MSQIDAEAEKNFAAVLLQLKNKFAGLPQSEDNSMGEEMEPPIPEMDNAANDQQMQNKVEEPVRLIVPTIKYIKRVSSSQKQLYFE